MKSLGALVLTSLFVLIYAGPVTAGPSPVVQGTVDGQSITVVMINSGGNGGATSAHVYWAGQGGNGPQTVDLGTIHAVSEYQNAYPDGLQIIFHGGKLLAMNKMAHDLGEDFVVRQIGFHGGKLVVEKVAKFEYRRTTWSESAFESAAENALVLYGVSR